MAQSIVQYPETQPYSEQSELLKANVAAVNHMIAKVARLVQHRRHNSAAIGAELAAYCATWQHTGLFMNSTLEELLREIGTREVPLSYNRRTTTDRGKERVLHVSTHSSDIGGVYRLIWRWINFDSSRAHSVAMTRHGATPIPRSLEQAVSARDGEIEILNRQPGSIIAWARRLREIAVRYDYVVLHTETEDVVPTIAFADEAGLPPIISVNHADHCYWTGASVINLLVNLRRSGQDLAIRRRGFSPEQCMILPTPLDHSGRNISRIEAKHQLGINDQAAVIVSIARATKYRTILGETFAQMQADILADNPGAVLIVVGAKGIDGWQPEIDRFGGRLRVVDETPDTSVFLDAADIYLDSYPIVSITSLLEAGARGLPLVSRSPFALAGGVLCADAPGMDGHIQLARTSDEYRSIFSALINDPTRRQQLGDATRAQIVKTHMGERWGLSLAQVYARAQASRLRIPNAPSGEPCFGGGPDRYLPSLFGKAQARQEITYRDRRLWPVRVRLSHWLRTGGQNRLATAPSLLPEWAVVRLNGVRYRSITPLTRAVFPNRRTAGGLHHRAI